MVGVVIMKKIMNIYQKDLNLKIGRKEIMDTELKQISFTDGGAYFLYSLPNVTRGMHGKTKSKVDEVLILGVPYKYLQNYCVEKNIVITNKAVYIDNKKILQYDGKGHYL